MISNEKTQTIGLRFTGQPFIDAGVATLMAAAKVDRPEDVTMEHVQQFIENDLLPTYINPFMSNYLGAVVYANVNFANPAMNTKPRFDDIRRNRLAAWLRLAIEADPHNRESLLSLIDNFRQGKRSEWLLPADVEPPDEGERCAFSGELAVIRVSRVIIPMTGSDEAVNFVPQGRPRLPIAGWVLLALLSMPMGTLNSGGQILLPHSMDTDLMLKLAKKHLTANRTAIQMEGIKKRPNFRFARTQIIKELLEIEGKWSTYPVNVYRFSSAGQSAKIEILSLESRVMTFLGRAMRRYVDPWNQVVARAWHMDADPDTDPGVNSKGEQNYERRNYFYEDLFDLPHNAPRFLRRYLLRQRRYGSASGKAKQDPRFGYSSIREREVISWNLTKLFMEVIMDIDKSRVEAIESLGDRLAEYIQKHDARLYQRMYITRKPNALRQVLLQASNNAKSAGLGTLMPFEEFMKVFFYESGSYEEGQVLREDWYMAHDLLMIRVIEQLTPDWVDSNVDLLEETDKKLSQVQIEEE